MLGVASVRAGCRQVIDVMAIVVENHFGPDNGRLFVVKSFRAQIGPAISDLLIAKARTEALVTGIENVPVSGLAL